MKRIILCALVLGVALPINAAEVDTDHLMFPEDVDHALAQADQQNAMDEAMINPNSGLTVAANDEVRRNTIERKFTSRRAYRNRSVKDKNQYDAEQGWVGATQVIEPNERKLEQVQRLNRRFISRRPYRH